MIDHILRIIFALVGSVVLVSLWCYVGYRIRKKRIDKYSSLLGNDEVGDK